MDTRVCPSSQGPTVDASLNAAQRSWKEAAAPQGGVPMAKVGPSASKTGQHRDKERILGTPGLVDSEEIARLAYSYWEARGFQGGSPEQDWFRAEEELRRQRTGAK